VLIVRRMPLGAYRSVLLALDRGEASAEALRSAEALVIDAAARAFVMHACQPQHSETKQESRAALRDWLMRVSQDASRYELMLENGATAAAVGNVTRRLNPDLLVLGTRGRGLLKRVFKGSVAERIIGAARSDVLVVPERSSGAAWKRRRSERQGRDA
jgi:nucleotide-binding universal stress UspA family protein